MTALPPFVRNALGSYTDETLAAELRLRTDWTAMTVPGLDPDSLTALAGRLEAPLFRHPDGSKNLFNEAAALLREASAALPALQRALDAAEAKRGIDQSAAIFYRDKFRAAESEVKALRAQLANIEATLTEARYVLADPGYSAAWTGWQFLVQQFVAALSVPAVPVDEELDWPPKVTKFYDVPAAPSPGPLNKEERP